MKKVLKVVVIVIFVIVIIISVALFALSKKSAAPNNYQKNVKTAGNIEKKYMANGHYQVKEQENGTLQEFKKYSVFYPAHLEKSQKKWPVIVLCNGSGTPVTKYPVVAKHYASWGFIVIGTEEEYSWNAFGAEMSIRYLKYMNENQVVNKKESIFYQKVDFNNVGVVGHSQGGVGVMNAITDTKHKDIYKTAVALSPTNEAMAHNLMWDYDPTKITIPILLISGAGGGDDWVITGDQLEQLYNDIPSQKVAMRRKNTIHNEVLYSADGYVMAWFMWQLQADEEAAKAFTGASPEILQNALYQDQKMEIVK